MSDIFSVAPISWIRILGGFSPPLSHIDGNISVFMFIASSFGFSIALRICALHTIDYCSLLSNRGIRFHQFFRSFDYSMKFFNSSICVFVVAVADCCCFCCTTSKSMCLFLFHLHFSFCLSQTDLLLLYALYSFSFLCCNFSQSLNRRAAKKKHEGKIREKNFTF